MYGGDRGYDKYQPSGVLLILYPWIPRTGFPLGNHLISSPIIAQSKADLTLLLLQNNKNRSILEEFQIFSN